MQGNARFLIVCAAAIGFAAAATPAYAGTGCNGVVNPFVWGCAPWDNNNGPKYPYYNKTQVTRPKVEVQIIVQDGRQFAKDLRTGQVAPVIAAGGGNVITLGGGN